MNREKKYFAAANTTSGFISYYKEVFGDCDSVYVIKGGSGTGKSRFMREVAEYAESRGGEVEYFYCSFDPLSLDGIIINGETAVIDGTAPHVYEPSVPGAKENIIDLGAFWNSNALKESKSEIVSFINSKKSCFDMAYSYLASVGDLDKTRDGILLKRINQDKISAFASRLITELKPQKVGQSKIRITSALGRSGKVKFDTYKDIATKSIAVGNEFGEGYIYLEAIKKEAERFGTSVTVSYSPVYQGKLDRLLIGGETEIYPEGFSDITLSESEAKEIKEINSISESIIKQAEKHFDAAARIHFEIEKIYVSAMDFSKKEEFTRDFIERMRF